MTITIQDRWNNIDGVDGVSDSDDRLEVYYILHADNDEDEEDVLNFLQANIPATKLGLFLQNTPFRRHEDTENHWQATAVYASGSYVLTHPKLDVGEVRWTVISGSGSTLKRTYSEELISETFATGVTKPELTGTQQDKLMGIVFRDGDYEAEGVDVRVGGTKISVQTVWNNATAVTANRIRLCSEYADQHATNSDAWNGYPAGTLQIDTFRATSRPGTDPDVDVSLTLDFSKNLTNINVGNGITVPTKKGHEVLDTLFTKKAVDGLPLPVPVRAAVHRPYPSISFASDIGI